jgi:hypothetical protein
VEDDGPGWEYWDPEPEREPRPPDPREEEAIEGLAAMFTEHRERVFWARQVEVMHEDRWFHWITDRALKRLVGGQVSSEVRHLAGGAPIRLYWHKSYRYYRREAQRVVQLVDEYSQPRFGQALGLQGEHMVLAGFAGREFLMRGRNTRAYMDRIWEETEHNLDFIFERDGVAYGVEVKNTLGYMELDELRVKVELCNHLEIKPVFVVRMLPKHWIQEVADAGGFTLVLKFQLYPWADLGLAKRVAGELGLPVDAPRALNDGTMNRFVKWHEKQVRA